MHTDRRFSDVLVRFGEVARFAARRAQNLAHTREEVLCCLESNIKAMARFFWFTVEFGLIREQGQLKVYGSGLLSSIGELEHSVESDKVQRFPIQLEWVINQYFEIDHYQPLLFYIDSFDHLFQLVDELERWLLEAKLDNVAPGEPLVNPEDLNSFLEARTEERS
jgi:phenylalanine-4-hydroxylase